MLIPSLVLAFQVSVSVGTDEAGVRVAREARPAQRGEVRRIPVTEEHLRTAFKDAAARDLLLRARAARMTQDSMLVSYDAKSYRRISAGMSLRATARERLAFRSENAARVQWHRDAGARVEVLGARAAVPFSREAEEETSGDQRDLLAIPYFPGKEQLWIGGELARAEVDERSLVHPIAEGSEAYYHFATGDSVLMALPDGKRITLRELRITAREPRWNVTVGSFWFETERAHLVRAVYRLSTPMDIWAVANEEEPGSMDDVPAWVRPLFTPMTADITAISVEYGLYNQRFWLPRLQGMEGYARVSFLRVPIKVEERYQYASVNGLDSLPAMPPPASRTAQEMRDSLREAGLDSADVRREMRAWRAQQDTLAKARRQQECAVGDTYTVYRYQYDGALPMALRIPCDTARLATSAELPPSIYDEGEDLFGARERDELVKALTMGLQPGWSPQRPTLEYGLAYTRFNRIEGFSTAAAMQTTLGSGYTTTLGLRGSAADAQLNGDVTLARSNGRSELRGTVYRRLAVSSDFGDPLSFGASFASMLYARDEGFYHRAWGAELAGSRPMRGGLDWRLFAEQQWEAPVENRWSLFGGANDDRFIENVVADRGWFYGGAARWRGSRGLDPRGWRVSADVRAEAATGDADYARGLIETTISRGLGPVAASLTGAAGTSGGTLPSQRHFFLGGLQTIRGQTAGTGYGESFWMGRIEVGSNRSGVRPVVFGDIGWAGPRDGWAEVGRPLSGVGVGTSFLDGMIRVDLARGIHPRWQTRLDLYLEARF
jgi:hypothetical protein